MHFWNEGVVLLCVVEIHFDFCKRSARDWEYNRVEIATKRVVEKLEERVEGVVEGKGVCHLHKPQVEVLCTNTKLYY